MITKENRFNSLWKHLNPLEFKAFEELLASHNLPLDHALSFTRARLVVACGFPLGMGEGRVFWHANYLIRDHGRKLKAFMESHKDLAPFAALHEKWCVKVTNKKGEVSYLTNGDRSCWSRHHAEKSARQFSKEWGVICELEPAQDYELG